MMMADWELYNDGFLVYKRRKRHLVLPPPPSEPRPDPQLEEKNRRSRKRRALLNLKDKYQNELDRWDFMSNSLRAFEESAQQQESQRWKEGKEDQVPSDVSPNGLSLEQRSMVDELLLKVEAEEVIIHNVLNLCDISEALWDDEEKGFTQTLFDLSIWGSPCSTLASLCDDC